jgi:Family of unknown function (DUF5677)
MTPDFAGELLGSRELADLASQIYRLGDSLRTKLGGGLLIKPTASNKASILFFARCFKTYQAAVELLRMGFWQDAAVLARFLREAEYQICWITKGGDDTGGLFLQNYQRNWRRIMRILAKHEDPEIRTQAQAVVESTPADETFDKWWANWWSPKRDEGIGWLAEKKLGRKAHLLEYAMLSAFVHTSPALLDFYIHVTKDGAVILDNRPGVPDENREFARQVAFSIFAAFIDACAAFTQQMGFGFEDELTQINERIRKHFP